SSTSCAPAPRSRSSTSMAASRSPLHPLHPSPPSQPLRPRQPVRPPLSRPSKTHVFGHFWCRLRRSERPDPHPVARKGSFMAAVKHAQSPLAPKTTPTLPRVAGVKLAAARSGVRYKDRDDVMLAVVPAGATIAGVLTRSKTASAPVDWCRKNLGRGKVRAIVANAGNANAFTGKAGDKAVD